MPNTPTLAAGISFTRAVCRAQTGKRKGNLEQEQLVSQCEISERFLESLVQHLCEKRAGMIDTLGLVL